MFLQSFDLVNLHKVNLFFQMSEITFSVIIPSYNKALYIKRAIDSLLNQSFKDFEIIVVENNSKDNSLEIIKSIHSKSINLISETKQGVSFARNTGIQFANGKYICFLDADDTYEPMHLEELNKLICLYPHSNLIANKYKIVDIHGVEKTLLFNPKWFNGNRYLLNNFFEAFISGTPPIHINSVCILKQTLIQNDCFDTNLKGCEDLDLWTRLFVNAEVIIGDYIGTTYYHNTLNKSHHSVHYESYRTMLQKFELLFQNNKSLWPYEKLYKEYIGCLVFGVFYLTINSSNKQEAKYWISRKELQYCHKKNAVILLKIMYYLPNAINQLVFAFLRKIGKLNI